MLDVSMLVPGSVVTHKVSGNYVLLAKIDDDYIFNRPIRLTERNLWISSATGEIVSSVFVGATAYNSLGPLRVIGKIFEELKVGVKVLIDTKENLVFRLCEVQSINLKEMTIVCNGVEIDVQRTEVYKTNY